jgi:hypothetical protein
MLGFTVADARIRSHRLTSERPKSGPSRQKKSNTATVSTHLGTVPGPPGERLERGKRIRHAVENTSGDGQPPKILLMFNLFVDAQNRLETIARRSAKQLTVFELFPVHFPSRADGMTDQQLAKSSINIVIEQ